MMRRPLVFRSRWRAGFEAGGRRHRHPRERRDAGHFSDRRFRFRSVSRLRQRAQVGVDLQKAASEPGCLLTYPIDSAYKS